MPTNRVGNTSVTGGATVVTPGRTNQSQATQIGNTTVSGGGTVRATPRTNQSLAGNNNQTTQNYSPTGGNPMTQPRATTTTATPTTTTTTATAPQGTIPLRQSLVERGVDNNRIGWNNGYVTIDGQNVYQPEYNIDGTTYADEYTINDITRQAYEQANDPLIAVRPAVSGYGLAGLVDWDGSNATIAGIPMNTRYVQDGTAYATEEDVADAVRRFEEATGYTQPRDVTAAYEDRYGDTVDNALNTLLNRQEWDYDPDTDLAWQAFVDQYTRLGDDAYRRALNANNSSVYGASGAANSEALAARNDYMQQLNDNLPELMRDSYNRYVGETDRLTNNLTSAQGVGNDYYNRQYAEQNDTYNQLRQSMQDNRDERHWWDESNRENAYAQRELEQADIYNGYYGNLLDAQINQILSETALNQLEEESGRNELRAQNSTMVGEWTPEQADYLGLVWDETQNHYIDPRTGRVSTPFTGNTLYGTAEMIPEVLGNLIQSGVAQRYAQQANGETPTFDVSSGLTQGEIANILRGWLGL